MGIQAIARALGVSKGTVGYHAKKLGITRPRSKYDWRVVQAYYDAGCPPAKCRRHFRMPQSAWAGAVKRRKLTVRFEDTRQDLSAAQYGEKWRGQRRGRSVLRAKILKEGLIPYNCALCKIDEWRGQPLTLRLDHISGDGREHGLDNLRFICPNCDSQLPTHGHRNRGRYDAL